jgi:hypothetical protein
MSDTPDTDDGYFLVACLKVVGFLVVALIARWLLIGLIQLPCFLCPF